MRLAIDTRWLCKFRQMRAVTVVIGAAFMASVNLAIISALLLLIAILTHDSPAAALKVEEGAANFHEIARLDHAGGKLVAFSGDGARILTAGKREVQVWDAKTYRESGPPIQVGDDFLTAAFDRRGDRVVTVDRTLEKGQPVAGGARVWDVRTGNPLGSKIRHGNMPLSQAAISPDGALIATCSETDKDTKVWEVATGRQKASLHQDHGVLSLRFDATGQRLITAGAVDRIWDTTSWKLRAEFAGTTAAGPPVPALAAKRHRIAIPRDSSFAVYDLESGKKLADNEEHALDIDEFLAGIALSPNAQYVATSSTIGGVVWDAATGEPLFQVADGFTGEPVFSPDSRQVIFPTPLEPIVWLIPDRIGLGLKEKSFSGAACFSPDGELLAIGSDDDLTSIFVVKPSTDNVQAHSRQASQGKQSREDYHR